MALSSEEAFWKEHQDSLIRIRSRLSDNDNHRAVRRGSSLTQGRKARTTPKQSHPPYGKYRQTPSPILPKVNSPQPNTPPLRGSKFDVVPPVKSRQAATRSKPDYDSWGEDSDDEEEKENDRYRYKPRPYPQQSPFMFGAPLPVYYPPPPRGEGRRKKRQDRRTPASKTYKDIYQNRKSRASRNYGKSKKQKRDTERYPLPLYGSFMVPVPVAFQPVDGSKFKDVRSYIRNNPRLMDVFANDLIKELLEEEIIPDTLVEALDEFERLPYDYPAYLPTLYACEDVMTDGIKELLHDIVKESASELAEDYLEEKRLQHDPLDEFLTSLLSDAVDLSVRELVREAVVEMAESHMLDTQATQIYLGVFQDHLKEIMPDVLNEVQFELIAEEFIQEEVIAPEVEEESTSIAKETLKHYDNKVARREFSEVFRKAGQQLADSMLVGYLMSVIARQGKLHTQNDHNNKYLDNLIMNIAMEQYFNVQKMRDKTTQNRPLRKLHEKAFIDVSLDACLKQLTASLDEDLADVDEYERGINDGTVQAITLSTR
ncbi:uncharacterized protein LOC112568978 isoform X2 [Pomacea canaliculata]|uniref:uncharacterized protein LOC112568978 isoform X2 n=1 Tax=Pomacea canaliculata TaxID=400727 RepID=UPI000D735DE7|nr:uncharacterized protein LOC112568978 isoform X2 [Pomacea canaliculata]